MPTLRIDLQEGFMNDSVVVLVNDKEVFNKQGVKTRMQTGYADAVEVEVPEGVIAVELQLPRKNLSERTEMPASSAMHLAASLTPENQIKFRVSQEPFGYV